jgi:hypothetical protein
MNGEPQCNASLAAQCLVDGQWCCLHVICQAFTACKPMWG